MLAESSLRQRPPEINEMYSFGLHQGVSGIEEGNLELDQETGLKSTLQLRGKVSERLHVDVRAYTHFFDGYIYLQPQQTFRLTIRGAFPVFTYEQCDARLLGGDAVIKYELSEHLNLESTWGYVYGMNTTEDSTAKLHAAFKRPKQFGLRDSAMEELAQCECICDAQIYRATMELGQ